MSSKFGRQQPGNTEGEQTGIKLSEKKPKLWKGVKPRVAIMRGTMAQSDIRFGHGSRNKQGASNAVVSIIYADIKKPAEWTSADMDNILRAGDQLYRTTITQMKIKGGTTFNPNCVYPTFYVAFHKVSIFIGSNVVTGELLPEPEVEEIFVKNLTELLQNSNGVILRLGEIYFAVWLMDKFFYCFCPHSGNEHGHFDRAACGTSFTLRIGEFAPLKEYFLDIYSGPYSLYSLKILKKSKIEKSLSKVLLIPQQQQSQQHQPEVPDESIVEPPVIEPEPEAKEEKGKGRQKGKTAKKDVKDDKESKSVSKMEGNLKEMDIGVPELLEPPISRPVFSNDYREISPERGILSANTYVKEPERILHTNVAAVFFLRFFRSSMWTKETMADILKLGKSIFETSSENGLTENENWQETIFFPIEYSKKLYNVQFEKIIFGEMVPTDPKMTCDFKQGVSDFFQRFDVGLVNGPQSVLLWQEAGIYFMFDPKERDGMGRKWTKLLSRGLGDVKNSGGACVTWYKNIHDLSEVYIANIQLKHRRDPYRIVTVEIIEETGKEEDFYEWKALDHSSWRILGEINLCEKSDESDLSRVNKAICVAVVASIFSKIRPMEEWTPATVEEIINTGVELYKQSLNLESYGEEEIGNPNFGYNDVKKITVIIDQRVSLILEECLIRGRVLSKENDRQNMNLEKGLSTFFQSSESGILRIHEFQIGVWHHDKFYYLFYPYERTCGRNEACICKEHDADIFGYAFVLRFKDISSITKELLTIFSLNENDEYCLTRVSATMFKADEKPPLHNYSDFTENGAMLRPFKDDYHEGHESFLIRADKQTMANVLVALGLAHINRAALWNKEDLIDILRIGDRIYCNLTNQLIECGAKNFNLNWDDINEVIIGSNKFSFSRSELTGMFEHPPRAAHDEIGGPTLMGEEEEEIEMEEEEILPDELKTVLAPWEKKDTVYAILECDFFKIAIWKQDELYFVFDPKASSDTGYLSQRRIQMGIDAITERNKFEQEGEEEHEQNLTSKESSKKKDYKEIPNEGAAYAAWFYNFDAFIEHILSKVPDEYHHEMFTLHLINMTNSWSVADDATGQNRHNFHLVYDGHMIMRANISQNEIMFPNRFKQEASNAIVALAFALISTCDRWTSTILDIILKYADRLYTKSFNLLKQEDPETACLAEKLFIENIVPSFRIYKIKFEFKIISKSSGGINTKDYKELKKAIGRIGTIEGNIGAAIRLKGYLNTIWRSGNSVYLFDPNETDPSGYVAKTGFASIARFNGMGAFFDFLTKKFGCLEGTNTFEAYIIEISHALTPMPTCDVCTIGNLDLLSKLTEGQTMFVPIDKGMRMLIGFIPVHKIPVILLCLAAIIHSKIHYVELWIDNVLEQIFFLAQYLLGKTKCELDKIKDVIKIDLEEMIPNFTIDNVLVHVNIHNVIQGPLAHSADIKNINLNNALKIYFRECSHAIITINDVSFALWKDCGVFYLFQDHSNINRRGSIIASAVLQDLYEIMIKGIDMSNQSNWYDIKNCKVTTIPIKETCRPEDNTAYEGSKAAQEERLCIKEIPSDVIEYCEECNYWDYITKKSKKSKLRKPRGNRDYKPISDEIDVLSGKILLEKHRLYCDKSKYRASLTAACLVAAGMRCINKLETWTCKIIDLIVLSGTILYMDTVAVKGITNLDITSFENIFYMCNHRLQVTACPPEKFLIDETLEAILTQLSKRHSMLYFMANMTGEEEGSLHLTLIFEDCFSYIFFPGGFGHCSKEMQFEKETACLMRFKNLTNLVKQLYTVTKIYVPVMSIAPIMACIK